MTWKGESHAHSMCAKGMSLNRASRKVYKNKSVRSNIRKDVTTGDLKFYEMSSEMGDTIDYYDDMIKVYNGSDKKDTKIFINTPFDFRYYNEQFPSYKKEMNKRRDEIENLAQGYDFDGNTRWNKIYEYNEKLLKEEDEILAKWQEYQFGESSDRGKANEYGMKLEVVRDTRARLRREARGLRTNDNDRHMLGRR